MEDLNHKLNKYIIKLNNLRNNEQINGINYDRYLLYLKKVNHYQNYQLKTYSQMTYSKLHWPLKIEVKESDRVIRNLQTV